MKSRRSVAYWFCTGFVVLVMGISGSLALLHGTPFMKALSHLGYPSYFSNLLGVGKLVGIVVLLSPGLPRFKEWAYVAFGITVLSASYSHYSSGDGWMALEPLLTFVALAFSYALRPAGRRLNDRSLV